MDSQPIKELIKHKIQNTVDLSTEFYEILYITDDGIEFIFHNEHRDEYYEEHYFCFDINKIISTCRHYYENNEDTCDCDDISIILIQRRIDIRFDINKQVQVILDAIDLFKNMKVCNTCNKRFDLEWAKSHFLNDTCENCIVTFYLNKESTDECSICLENIHPIENRISICGTHFIHKSCCDKMKPRNICPLCRGEHVSS